MVLTFEEYCERHGYSAEDVRVMNQRSFRAFQTDLETHTSGGLRPNEGTDHFVFRVLPGIDQLWEKGIGPSEIDWTLRAYKAKVEADFEAGDWTDKWWDPIELVEFVDSPSVVRKWRRAVEYPSGVYKFIANQDASFTVAFQGDDHPIQKLSGMALIQVLLRNPGREFNAIELEVLSGGEHVPSLDAESRQLLTVSQGLPGEALLDSSGEAVIRATLQEMKEELSSEQDPYRSAEKSEKIAALEKYLRQSRSPQGRPKRSLSPVQAAAKRVRTNIKYAIRKLRRNLPALASYLEQSLELSGTFHYSPNPKKPIKWTF